MGRPVISEATSRLAQAGIIDGTQELAPDLLPAVSYAQWLKDNRVSRRAYSRVEALTGSYWSEVSSALAARMTGVNSRVQLLDPSWELVRELASGIPALPIKGARMIARYGDGVRDVSDLDLFVDDITDAWTVAGRLLRSGYVVAADELPWIKVDVATGTPYGQIVLEPDGDDGRRDRLRLDIHFAGYSVRHCGFVGLSISSWDANSDFLCTLGNAAGDCCIRLKDVNDLRLLACDDTFDPHRAADLVTRAGIEAFAGQVLAAGEAVCAAWPPALGRVLQSLQVTAGRRERIRPFASPRRLQRWTLTTRHAWRLGRRQSLARAISYSLSGARYYARARQLTRTRTAPRRPPPLNNVSCLRLVELGTGDPPDHSRDTVTICRYSGGNWLVRAGPTLFAPTIYMRVPRDIDVTSIGPPLETIDLSGSPSPGARKDARRTSQ